ncbi:MAG: UDPglucose--hexose-phosphate uridylyltransferase [Acidimicrobiaceae bacterium]|nr:UDPglucose--hexose-phosphate uridylyltransferase [Acidimicrobiaceae bacterium]
MSPSAVLRISFSPLVSQLRLDPLTGRWVVHSIDRSERPFAFLPRALPVEGDPTRPCPFCPGNEDATPPALEAYGPGGNWQVRVVPNLFPAFSGDAPMVVNHLGPVFTQAPGSGIHEVLVLTPDHKSSWADLADPHAGLVMAAIRDRMEEHASLPGLRYTQAIVNCGREAGASLEHPHGQLLGMPFVPGEIADEVAGFSRFEGNCLLCTAAEAEEAVGHRMVYSDDRSLVLCPFWSGTPYEMLIMPRVHDAHLHHARPGDVASVGRALRIALIALRQRLGDVPYNMVLHSAPYRTATSYHWHAHLLPKVTTRAGFELGTGVLINVVGPENAAADLRASAHAAA